MQTPPWGRWSVAGLIVTAALWVEFRPDPLVDHPFAVAPIVVGEEVNETNTVYQRIPAEILEPVVLGQVAVRAVSPRSPVLADDLGVPESIVPEGWWVVSTDVPASASPGDVVRLILLDQGTVVDGVVAATSTEDPFASSSGAVAVPSESAAEVATAASDGRLAVLVSTG